MCHERRSVPRPSPGEPGQTDRPVGEGPLFEVAPAIDDCLNHLFGAVFERDNLDWQSRQLATVSFPSALPGVQSQLQSHIRISRNVGLTESRLRQLADVLQGRVGPLNGQRTLDAISAVAPDEVQPSKPQDSSLPVPEDRAHPGA